MQTTNVICVALLFSGLMLAQDQPQRPNGGTAGQEKALHSTPDWTKPFTDVKITPCKGDEPCVITVPDKWIVHRGGSPLTEADKLRVKDAQLRRERALTVLLQSPQYAALTASDVDLAAVIADVEKRASCKLEPATAECVPPAKH